MPTHKQPLISVIMNCLNGEKYLREAIESVYAQTYSDWEIIFWDNASTDETPAIVSAYDKKIRYFRGGEVVPLYEARNLAVAQARGKYLAFLDVDDEWLPSKLEKQVELLKKNSELGLVYANYFKDDLRTGRSCLAHKKKMPRGRVFAAFSQSYPICMSTAMIRNTADAVTGSLFDDRLNLCGDYDTFMNILYESEVAYISEPMARYRIHEGMCSKRCEDDFADELSLVIENMERRHEGFADNRSSEYMCLKAHAAYVKVLATMRNGRTHEARDIMKPYKNMNIKYLLAYLGTFLTPSLWKSCRRLKSKIT